MEEHRDCDKVPATTVCSHIGEYSEDHFLQASTKFLPLMLAALILDPKSGCHHDGPA
jgi:hypothetical protein